jgi:hypothetical protein
MDKNEALTFLCASSAPAPDFALDMSQLMSKRASRA